MKIGTYMWPSSSFGGFEASYTHSPQPLHPARCLSGVSLLSSSLIHTPTPARGDLAPALVHSRGRVTQGVAGQAAVLSFSQPLRGSHLEILGPFWARVQPRGIRPDAGFDGTWKAASDGHGPADDFFAHGDARGLSHS